MSGSSNSYKNFSSSTDLSSEEVQQYNQLFTQFDQDSDGFITISEVKAVVEASGINISEEHIISMFHIVDTDGDGQIDFEEFCSMMFSHRNSVNSDHIAPVLEAFRKLAEESSNTVLVDELLPLLTSMGDSFTEEEAHDFIDSIQDYVKDGKLDYSRYVMHNV
ncbi:hypothetical protein P9112_000795 [Eukaryota sp. TZLM1-RC]